MKIWVVMEYGYEYSVPVSAFFTEKLEIYLCEANCQTAVEAT